MNAPTHSLVYLLSCILTVALQPPQGVAQQSSDTTRTSPQHVPTKRDGQHDFDFEVGTWKTHLSRRLDPLSGSTTWVEYEGTSVVRKVWNGRANLLELEVDGPANHIEGLSLRLYNPESHQWSLNFSNSAGGTLSEPVLGEFNNGRGEFFGQESLNGRAIFVRFVISCISQNSCHFEQAFSDDGGKTWEANWVATDTRVKGESDGCSATPMGANPAVSGPCELEVRYLRRGDHGATWRTVPRHRESVYATPSTLKSRAELQASRIAFSPCYTGP